MQAAAAASQHMCSTREALCCLAVRQLAASEEACLDALCPPTPCGAREAHLEIVSSQESTELDTEDALAWYVC